MTKQMGSSTETSVYFCCTWELIKMSPFRNKLKELFIREVDTYTTRAFSEQGMLELLILKILDKQMAKKSTYTLV